MILTDNRFAILFSKRKEDEEFLQVLARIFFFFFILAIVIIFDKHYLYDKTIQIVILLFMLFIITHAIWVIKKPGEFFYRRLLAMVSDIGLISYFTYLVGMQAIMFYPVLIWTIMATGLRYGTKYFYTALLTGLILYSIALHASPFWSQHYEMRISLIAGLMVMVILNRKILRHLSLLRDNFDKKLKKQVGALTKEYHYDSLTGLQNRVALEKALKNEPFNGLIVVDIDGFRHLNELYGMHTGDQVLKSFADSLEKFTKKKQYDLYRIYGDVFALRPKQDHIDIDYCETIIEELYTYIENLLPIYKNVNDFIKLDVTMGISLEAESALNKAEMALSFAKNNSKKYIAYSKIMDSSKTISELLQRKQEIKSAIHSDNIVPVFQSIVNRTQHVSKYEALMRIRKVSQEKEEFVSPYFFLDAAIKTKQYETLTLIMIEKSFKLMNKLNQPFSLNLSFNDILNEKVISTMKSNIEKYNIGKKLTIEILESENIEDYIVIKNFITEFKKMGVKIAIDDFGSGFSNFTHLLELEPDFLKIDGSLIKNIDQDKRSYAFVKSIVSLAKELKIQTVAEFVSTKEIFDVTHALGIDFFQGYYFSTPLQGEYIPQK